MQKATYRGFFTPPDLNETCKFAIVIRMMCMDRRSALSWAALTPLGSMGLAPQACAAAPWVLDVIDVAPYGGLSPTGEVMGVMADFAQALAKAADRPIETRLVPIARAIQDVNRNAADLSIMLPVPGLAPEVKAIARLTQLEVEVLPRKGVVMDSKASLRGLRIASLSAGAGYSMIADLDGVIHQRTNTLTSMMQLLRSGRVDGVASVRQSLRYGMREEGMRASEFGTPYVLGLLDLTLWGSPALLDADRAALADAAAKVTRTGVAARIVAKHTATV